MTFHHLDTRKSGLALWFIALATAILFGMHPGTAMAQEDDGVIEVVLLGDSYSAGNGAGGYWQDDVCRRSVYNWAEQYVKRLREEGHEVAFINEACNGAVTEDVRGEDGQDDAVSSSTDLVLLTIGGNDAGFGAIVRDCFAMRLPSLILPIFEGPWLCMSQLDRAAQAADDPGPDGLEERILDVLVTLRDEGLREDVPVVLLSYPYLELGGDVWQGYPVGQMVRALGDLGDDAQAAAVAAANAEGMNVLFLDTIKGVFAGHENDGSPVAVNPDRWFHDFSDAPVWRRWEWFHPNPTGHEKYADALYAADPLPDPAPPNLGRLDAAWQTMQFAKDVGFLVSQYGDQLFDPKIDEGEFDEIVDGFGLAIARHGGPLKRVSTFVEKFLRAGPVGFDPENEGHEWCDQQAHRLSLTGQAILEFADLAEDVDGGTRRALYYDFRDRLAEIADWELAGGY